MTIRDKKSLKKENVFQIFNLEYPPYIEELKIGDYVFKRVVNYEKAYENMMWLVNSFGNEFNTQIKNGSHQITAEVKIPQKEKKSVLQFANKNSTQLDDILFLLTIFTDRNVFKKDWKDNENTVIVADHKIHQYGGQLACSIKYESKWKHQNTGVLKDKTEIKGIPMFNYYQVNVGFEKTINNVLNLISSKEWQEEYECGHFLFLFKSVMQWQIIETAFISCWTIWEHIFAIKNRKWLDTTAIVQMSGDKKIAFILSEYFSINIDNTARENIQKINKTRNRIIHYGKKTEQIDYKEMEMFIRITEQLVAIILGLSPSNILNSSEKLDSFLKGKKNREKTYGTS